MICVSNRDMWDIARDAYEACDNILIALPLEGECVPELLTQFLATLAPKNNQTTISFILHGGSDETIELENGEGQLKDLAAKLGCTYGGAMIKSSKPNLRFMSLSLYYNQGVNTLDHGKDRMKGTGYAADSDMR